MRVGGCTVASCAADLLVIGFDARQIDMEDEPYVRFVDPHTKRDGCHDNHAGISHERILVRLAIEMVHTVVGQGVDTPVLQIARGLSVFLRDRQ